jgi:hypothetical protein
MPPHRSGDRIPSDRVALDLIKADGRRTSHENAQVSAVQDARQDLQALKATVRRLTSDCDTIVQRNEVRPGDAPTPRNRGRDALHLQARANAVALLIQETERVLDQLEARE